jgi:hypothetical protein
LPDPKKQQPATGASSAAPQDSLGYRCGNPQCGASLVKCYNYAVENVCNRCIVPQSDGQPPEPLCDCCRYNDTIPDLTVPGNREKWYRLEVAKRRMFYTVNLLGLRYGKASDGHSPPLAFDFKADVIPAKGMWRTMGTEERVFTGHADGKITINIREADDVEREKLRVDFQEAHRTPIGHFHHEIGHYYWQALVVGKNEFEFQQIFGDPHDPPYADALEAYYQNGPQADWQANFVSAYATMHPWEDFAETFATYLDMISVLHTANHYALPGGIDVHIEDAERIIKSYQRLGVAMNEMNRCMGLPDLVPEIFVQPVRDKMSHIHSLVRESSNVAAEVCR